MQENETKKVVVGVYVRVSTLDQSREGHSIDEQKDYLRRFCEFNKYEIYKYYEDPAYTGKNTNRPALNEMIEDVKTGKINKILVYKFDRLTRSAFDMEEICRCVEDQYNCPLESASEKIDTSTAMGKFFRRIMVMIAQWEVETISERTIFGLEGAVKGKKKHIIPILILIFKI